MNPPRLLFYARGVMPVQLADGPRSGTVLRLCQVELIPIGVCDTLDTAQNMEMLYVGYCMGPWPCAAWR